MEKRIIFALNLIKMFSPANNLAIKLLDRYVYKSMMANRTQLVTKKMAEERYYAVRSIYQGVSKNYCKGIIKKQVVVKLVQTLGKSVFMKSGPSKKARAGYFEKNNQNPPGFVTISPTQKCNLRCTGCYAASNPGTCATIDWSTLDKLMHQLHDIIGMRFFVISGGEPFLYESCGHNLIDLAKKWDDSFFLVYTNGTHITKEIAQALAECGNITPAISVEGYEEETDARRGKGVFKRILKAISNLREAGVPFGMSVTATRTNVDLMKSYNFYDYYFEELGASYMWVFQLMPIGRAVSAELMVTPEQRVELLTIQRDVLKNRKYFIADFWNSAVLSDGCIACGRKSGYFYINWDGNIMPCVFIPYYLDNIYQLFKEGKTIEDAMNSELFNAGRDLQTRLKYNNGKLGNLLMPCLFRDHHKDFTEILDNLKNFHCENTEAKEAYESGEYHETLQNFDIQLEKLTSNIWEEEFQDQNH